MSSFFFKFRCDPKYESTIKQMYDISMMVPSVSNLDTISLIAKSLNYPHLFYPKIHVGGTNGKGSVIKKISSILTKSGYKIGTYSSPHISSFRERIKINNKPIPKKNVVSIFNLIKKHMNLCNLPLPYFELLTMMAFEYFKEEEVDCAVIEVGMGGDLDATNIIDPLLSIITSIGLDHTNVLGNSLEEISKHKAGIIKPNIPVILGNDIPTIDVFTNKAKEMNSPIYYSTHNYKSETYDEENNETVKLAIDALRKSYPNKFNMISEESIEYGSI